jgi:hypothetical protein
MRFLMQLLVMILVLKCKQMQDGTDETKCADDQGNHVDKFSSNRSIVFMVRAQDYK